MNMLSLTKIGNLKLGLVKNGKPIQTSRILVTYPTKEGGENFKIWENFNPDGEASLNVKLPFDSVDLNFEKNFVGYVLVDNKEYIAKSEDLGKNLYFYPLNPEDFDEPVIDVGELTEEMITQYALEKTGFLKCMIEGLSSYGEVFYFKTKSINSIRSIEDQLRLLSSLTGGILANIPLEIKAVKKDSGDNQIVFLSIGFKDLSNLNKTIEDRKNESINYSAFEELYIKEREPDRIVALKDINKPVQVLRDTESEIEEIVKNASIETEKSKIIQGKIKNILKEKVEKYPMATLIVLFNIIEEAEFKKFFEEERELKDILLYIKEIKKS